MKVLQKPGEGNKRCNNIYDGVLCYYDHLALSAISRSRSRRSYIRIMLFLVSTCHCRLTTTDWWCRQLQRPHSHYLHYIDLAKPSITFLSCVSLAQLCRVRYCYRNSVRQVLVLSKKTIIMQSMLHSSIETLVFCCQRSPK